MKLRKERRVVRLFMMIPSLTHIQPKYSKKKYLIANNLYNRSGKFIIENKISNDSHIMRNEIKTFVLLFWFLSIHFLMIGKSNAI